MRTVGDFFDNALCESLFATPECELLDRRCFATKAEAPMAIFIEHWYNLTWRHVGRFYTGGPLIVVF
jgi:putative transposase